MSLYEILSELDQTPQHPNGTRDWNEIVQKPGAERSELFNALGSVLAQLEVALRCGNPDRESRNNLNLDVGRP